MIEDHIENGELVYEDHIMNGKLVFTDREKKALQLPLNQIQACFICHTIDIKRDMLRLGCARGSWPPMRKLGYVCQACFQRLCDANDIDPLEYFR